MSRVQPIGLALIGTGSGFSVSGVGALSGLNPQVEKILDVHLVKKGSDKVSWLFMPGRSANKRTILLGQLMPARDYVDRAGFWGVAALFSEEDVDRCGFGACVEIIEQWSSFFNSNIVNASSSTVDLAEGGALLAKHGKLPDAASFEPFDSGEPIKTRLTANWRGFASISEVFLVIRRGEQFADYRRSSLLISDREQENFDLEVTQAHLSGWLSGLLDASAKRVSFLEEALSKTVTERDAAVGQANDHFKRQEEYYNRSVQLTEERNQARSEAEAATKKKAKVEQLHQVTATELERTQAIVTGLEAKLGELSDNQALKDDNTRLLSENDNLSTRLEREQENVGKLEESIGVLKGRFKKWEQYKKNNDIAVKEYNNKIDSLESQNYTLNMKLQNIKSQIQNKLGLESEEDGGGSEVREVQPQGILKKDYKKKNKIKHGPIKTNHNNAIPNFFIVIMLVVMLFFGCLFVVMLCPDWLANDNSATSGNVEEQSRLEATEQTAENRPPTKSAQPENTTLAVSVDPESANTEEHSDHREDLKTMLRKHFDNILEKYEKQDFSSPRKLSAVKELQQLVGSEPEDGLWGQGTADDLLEHFATTSLALYPDLELGFDDSRLENCIISHSSFGKGEHSMTAPAAIEGFNVENREEEKITEFKIMVLTYEYKYSIIEEKKILDACIEVSGG